MFPQIPFPSKKVKVKKKENAFFPDDLSDFDSFTTTQSTSLAHIHNFSTQPLSSTNYGVNINNNTKMNCKNITSTPSKNSQPPYRSEYLNDNYNNSPDRRSQKISSSYEKLSPGARNKLLSHEAHLAAAFGLVNVEKPTFTIGGKVVIKNLTVEEHKSSVIFPNKKEVQYSTFQKAPIGTPSNTPTSTFSYLGNNNNNVTYFTKEPPQPCDEPCEEIFEFTPTPKKSKKRKRKEKEQEKYSKFKKRNVKSDQTATNGVSIKQEKVKSKQESPKKIQKLKNINNDENNITLNEVPNLNNNNNNDNIYSTDVFNFTSPNLPSSKSPKSKKLAFLRNNSGNNNSQIFTEGISQDIMNSQMLSCVPRCSIPSSAQVLETTLSLPSPSPERKRKKIDEKIVRENLQLKKEISEMKYTVGNLTKRVQELTSFLEQHCPSIFQSVNT